MVEYIAYKLTGQKRAELSLASRTIALDIATQQWSKDIERIFNIEGIFNNFVPSAVNFAQLSENIVNKLNYKCNISVSIGGHDHMCGSIAANLREDEILNSTGATEGLLMLIKEANYSTEFFEKHISNGVYVDNIQHTLYSSLPAAGYSIEWFRKQYNVDDSEFLELLQTLAKEISNTDYIKQKDNIFIPHLRDSGPPYRNINSKGLWYGLNENTDKKDILLTIFRGLCFELKNILNSTETLTHTKHSTIKVIGAASKSPVWLQLKADILGRKIISCNIQEVVCKGAVLLAGYKNGYLSRGDGIQLNNDLSQEYIPNKDLTSFYENIFQTHYKPLYQFKSVFETNNTEN